MQVYQNILLSTFKLLTTYNNKKNSKTTKIARTTTTKKKKEKSTATVIIHPNKNHVIRRNKVSYCFIKFGEGKLCTTHFNYGQMQLFKIVVSALLVN